MSRFARWLSLPLFILMFSVVDVPRAEEEDPSFSQRELDRMLAPIALYPDVVLSQVLMAATYPLEVVEAARWSKANPRLAGEAAVEAVAEEDWDASVKALVAFPRLLARMDEDLDWTRRVGDAFLFQQVEVMDTIQDLRRRAYEAGNLDSLDHARVVREGDTLIIEPADTEIVYVPYYDTRVVYGTWRWPAYPPYYWVPPGYYSGAGFYWSGGVPYSSDLYFSHFSWPYRHIVIMRPLYARAPGPVYGRDHDARGGARHWRHDPRHRRGVVYRDRGRNHEYGWPRASAGGGRAGDYHADRPGGGRYQYRHGVRSGGYAAGLDAGRGKSAGRGDTPRAIADDGRPQAKRYSGKRRSAATVAPAGRAGGADADSPRVTARESAARPPRAPVTPRSAGGEAGYYSHPRQAASRATQTLAPRPGASGQVFGRR